MRFAVRNRVFLFADLIGWALIPVAALILRVDGLELMAPYLPHLLAFTLGAIGCKLAALWSFGLYRRYWRYASMDELGMITVAVIGAGLAASLVYYAFFLPFARSGQRVPTSVPVLDTLLTLFYVGGTRFAARMTEHLRQKLQGRVVRERVLIAGAGDAGSMIARELRANPQLELEPVGFVDDNPHKHGNEIHGVPVLGGRGAIPELARDYAVTQVIIAMPGVPGP